MKSEDTSYSLDNWWNSLSSMINYEDQHIYCSYTVSDPYKTVIIDGKNIRPPGQVIEECSLKLMGWAIYYGLIEHWHPFLYGK